MSELAKALIVSCLAGFIVAIVLRIWTKGPLPLLAGIIIAGLSLGGLYWLLSMPAPAVSIFITAPADGTEVELSQVIKGTVSPASARVFVLIHPMPTDMFWVQNIPLVGNDGTWRTNGFFGTKEAGIGDSYEIVAIALAESWVVRWLKGSLLRPGATIKELPRDVNKSNVVTVRRSK